MKPGEKSNQKINPEGVECIGLRCKPGGNEIIYLNIYIYTAYRYKPVVFRWIFQFHCTKNQ